MAWCKMSYLQKNKITKTDLKGENLGPQKEVTNVLVIDMYSYMEETDLSSERLMGQTITSV